MLDKRATMLLKALYKTDFLKYEDIKLLTGYENRTTDPVVILLTRYSYIAEHYSGKKDTYGGPESDGCEITIEGRAYLEQVRHEFWAFFLPYAITTIIALLSLITSIAGNWAVIQGWFCPGAG